MPTYTITELAREFDITARAIRFYEDQGLLSPSREGAGGRNRLYTPRDRTRLKLTLRGKRLGFTIREIREFLNLYDSDPAHREQMEHLLARVRERLDGLKQQMAALEETIGELRVIESEALERLR